MMGQKPQVVDLTRSYMPGDPNAFPSNLISTKQEDLEEKEPAVIIYEGYNFLPTSYGYKSYFGENSKLDIQALPAKCDTLFVYQLANRKNIIIALCDSGLWYTDSTTLVGAVWTQGVTLAVPAAGTYKEWTTAVIENVLYVYRQGEASYWKIAPTAYTESAAPVHITLTIVAVVPTFLNMAGQLGIFRASASLAFWDSANSIGWSSPLDLKDFTPSLTTLAGNAIFSGILGSIVTIKSQGDDFVIYTTVGIVGVRYINSSTVLWESTSITDTAGIAYPKAVTGGITEREHYVYSNTGIKKIGSYNALNKSHSFDEILTEVYDILRENNETVYMSFLNGRYLTLSLLNSDYINGRVTYEFDSINGYTLEIKVDGVSWDGVTLLPGTINGNPLNSELLGGIIRGNKVGMYTHWSGSGVGSFSGITTPMHYYKVNASGDPVAQAIHSTALFDAFGLNADTAPIGAYVSMATPTFPIDMSQLKYAKYGSLDHNLLGKVDGGLPAYIGAQLAEWTNFTRIQAANLAQIQAIPPGQSVTTLGTVFYPDDEIYVLPPAIAAFAASVADAVISGNSVTYTDFDAGDFLAGSGTITEPGVSGAGNNYATYTLVNSFLGGYNVKRKKTRTFTFSRTGPDTNYYYTTIVGGGLGSNPSSVLDDMLARTYYGETEELAYANALAGLIANCPASFYDFFGDYYTKLGVITEGIWDTMGYHKWGQYPMDTSTRLVRRAGTGGYYTTVKATHYLDYTEMAFIEVDDRPLMANTATMNAYQSNLTWFIMDPANPPAHPYSTGGFDGDGLGAGGYSPGATFGYTYPGATYLLQDGTPAPLYPTYVGALVLDVPLKKWGKMKAEYTALLDYSTINAASDITSYSNLGVNLAILKATGVIYNMDSKPLDSYIKYGKIGFYRLGYTCPQEVKVAFRLPFTGAVTIDTSYNGISTEPALKQVTNFDTVLQGVALGGFPGKWHSIKISGNYDLQYLEIRGTITGRR